MSKLPTIEPEIPLFPDFDSTLTSGLDETASLLRLPEDYSPTPSEHKHQTQLSNHAVLQLVEEVKALREAMATTIETVNLKASKATLKAGQT